MIEESKVATSWGSSLARLHQPGARTEPLTTPRTSHRTMLRRHSYWLVTLALILLLLLQTSTASYTVNIEPDEVECFYVQVPKDRAATLSGTMDCWERGRMRGCRSIAAWIEMVARKKDPKNIWSNNPKKSEEDFAVTVQSGKRYRFCMQNNKLEGRDVDDEILSDFEIQVGFDLRLQMASRALPDEEIGPDAQRALDLVQAAAATERQWQNLLDHFDFLRNREAILRQLSGQINDRVMGWTIVEAVLVVTMAVAQVWYWKSFFEQRRYL